MYQAIREATRTVARREDFRIVHLSIQRTHIHLLVEAKGKVALAAGMQGFQISAAKHLNAAISQGRPGPRRRGTVFPDRYHAVVIASPRQARHALSYVINNWRKHAEDRGEVTRRWDVDWYSSGAMFPDWKESGENGFVLRGPSELPPMRVGVPRTWLCARVGRGTARSRAAKCHPQRGSRHPLDGSTGCASHRRGDLAPAQDRSWIERRSDGAPRGDAHRRAAGGEARGCRLVTARDRSQKKICIAVVDPAACRSSLGYTTES